MKTEEEKEDKENNGKEDIDKIQLNEEEKKRNLVQGERKGQREQGLLKEEGKDGEEQIDWRMSRRRKE